MSTPRNWQTLACAVLLAGCGGGSSKGKTQAPEAVSTEVTTVEDKVESEAEQGASEEFRLPPPQCNGPLVTVYGRAVVTIDGEDSPNRVDVIAMAPKESADVACRLALQSHHLSGNLSQRVLRECSEEPIAQDQSKSGWDLVNPTIADGFGLRMLVGKADDVEMDDCTRVALIYLSNYPEETACRDLVTSMEESRKRSTEASHAAVTKFLDEQLEREATNIQDSCPKVDAIDAECTKMNEVAKTVSTVCEDAKSKACTRAKEAGLLLEQCQMRHRRMLQDCESATLRQEELQKRRDAPPEEPNEPLPYCRPASS